MELKTESLEIEHPAASALAWDGDDLVEVMTGRRIRLDGTVSDRAFFVGYEFDRALCFRTRDAFWTLAYENRGTKAVLFKNWMVHRELNRSYYCAKAFDYPIAFTCLESERIAILHCPNSYDTIEVEDAETGEILGKKKSPAMEFHSRLAVSGDGRFVVSAGWFWHPLGGAWLCPLSELLGAVDGVSKEMGFSFGAEIDSATFLGDDHVVLSSTSEFVNADVPASGLGPLQLGVWSVANSAWVSTTPLEEPTGITMPWRDWVISFYKYPKAIELATGKVVHVWRELESGTQIGSIDLGTPPPPVIAMNPGAGFFAVCDAKKITVVSLHSLPEAGAVFP